MNVLESITERSVFGFDAGAMVGLYPIGFVFKNELGFELTKQTFKTTTYARDQYDQFHIISDRAKRSSFGGLINLAEIDTFEAQLPFLKIGVSFLSSFINFMMIFSHVLRGKE